MTSISASRRIVHVSVVVVKMLIDGVASTSQGAAGDQRENDPHCSCSLACIDVCGVVRSQRLFQLLQGIVIYRLMEIGQSSRNHNGQ